MNQVNGFHFEKFVGLCVGKKRAGRIAGREKSLLRFSRCLHSFIGAETTRSIWSCDETQRFSNFPRESSCRGKLHGMGRSRERESEEAPILKQPCFASCLVLFHTKKSFFLIESLSSEYNKVLIAVCFSLLYQRTRIGETSDFQNQNLSKPSDLNRRSFHSFPFFFFLLFFLEFSLWSYPACLLTQHD